MSRACCGFASFVGRCGAYMFVACIVGWFCAARACLLCLFLFCLFRSRSVLFCSVWVLLVLLALSLFFLSLSLSLSLPLSLSLLASAVGMGLIYLKRNARTQTLERCTYFLCIGLEFCRQSLLSWVVVLCIGILVGNRPYLVLCVSNFVNWNSCRQSLLSWVVAGSCYIFCIMNRPLGLSP